MLASPSFLLAQSHESAQARITVEVNKSGHKISPMLFGIFFEDINLSTDGGMHTELVRSHSFEDADSLQNWKFRAPMAKAVQQFSITKPVALNVQSKIREVFSLMWHFTNKTRENKCEH